MADPSLGRVGIYLGESSRLHSKITLEQNDLEVVFGWDGPGRDRGLPGRKLQTGGGLAKRLYIFSIEEKMLQ